MPRLNAVEPVQAEGRAKELFSGPLQGRHYNMYKALAASPAALESLINLESAARASSLTSAEQQIVHLAIAQSLSCHYALAAHAAAGRAAGLTAAEITQARRGTMPDPRHHALARFALAIHEKLGRVSDADIAAFRAAGFGDASIADTIAIYAQAIFECTFSTLNQTPVDFPPVPDL